MNGTIIRDFIHCGSIISMDGERLVIGWGERCWFSNAEGDACSFYAPDFFLSESRPWFRHKENCTISKKKLKEYLLDILGNEITPKYQWESPDSSLFSAAFDRLQEDYRTHMLQKAVLFVLQNAQGEMSPQGIAASLIRVLEYAERSPVHIYGFWEGTRGVLGATPELLFRFIGDNPAALETVACAGTRPFHHDRAVFIPNEKENDEHQIVIEGIRKALAPFGELLVGSTKSIDLPPISHLITPIVLRGKSTLSFEAMIRALHPTPALGAYPREQGWKWLLDYQTLLDRKRYGAPFGCVYPEERLQICYVAIRNVQWGGGKLMIGAGCGVVKDSKKESEWEEILLKLKAVKRMLAL